MKTQLSIEDYELCNKLKNLRFSGMAEALEELLLNPNADLLPFRQKVQKLVDAERDLRYNKKLNRFIKKATLKYPGADFDNSIYDPERMLDTINYLNRQPIQGIKLQLLHVLKGTDLADDYLAGKFQTLSREEYLNLLISCLEHLSPNLVIHRVTGDGPKNLLIAPLWSSAKRSVLNDLHHLMKIRNTWQGRLYKEDLYD